MPNSLRSVLQRAQHSRGNLATKAACLSRIHLQRTTLFGSFQYNLHAGFNHHQSHSFARKIWTGHVESHLPVEPEERARPFFSYRAVDNPPTLHYIRDVDEANRLISELKGPLGFDLEWRVVFSRWNSQSSSPTPAVVRKVALVQLCDDNNILLIQVSAMKEFPQKLKQIIESEDIIKTGVNIANDAKKLFKDFSILSRNAVELSALAVLADAEYAARRPRKITSLAKLVESYTDSPLDKNAARMSNWEALLTEAQLEYAANDCYASLLVYRRLMGMAAENDRSPSPEMYTIDLKQTLLSAIPKLSLPKTRSDKPSPSRKPSSSAISDSEAETILLDIQSTASPKRKAAVEKVHRIPRALQAYHFWHDDVMELDQVCIRMRSEEKPLQRSTVGTYILKALEEDRDLPYDRDRLKELLSLLPPAPTRTNNFHPASHISRFQKVLMEARQAAIQRVPELRDGGGKS